VSATIENVLASLKAVRQAGGGWLAQCPAHDDDRASLSVSRGRNGGVLVNCHAGCEPAAVATALGLTLADLMPPGSTSTRNGRPRIVKTHDYRDEAGELVFQVCRKQPKGFQQRRPKPGGGWEWNTKGVRVVPYRLPELLAEPTRPVLVVEGEKDADALASLGFVATCNSGGAGKWRPEHAEFLRGRGVVILPDNDGPGRDHARQVAASLQGVGRAVRIVDLPDLPAKGDVSDWLAAGGTRDELARLVRAAPEWEPTAESAMPQRSAATTKADPEPFAPFPTHVLPPIVRDFVRQGARALGCDASYVALPLLAALASAIGNTRRITLKRSWKEPCVVWAVVVGDSGTLKSPALDLAMKPLRRLQSRAFREHEETMAAYRIDKATYDADLAAWKSKGRKRGEPPPDEPEEPIAARYLCDDATVEAVAVLLQRCPRGLLLGCDELSGWVNGFDAYKTCRGADVARWLSMHRAGPVTVDRKSGAKLIHAPRGAMSITGGVQPGALAAALVGRCRVDGDGGAQAKPDREHFDNGLAARLLFTMPPKRPKRWSEADLPRQTEEAMEALFCRLLELDFAQDDEGELQPIDLPLSCDGKAAWVSFYNAHAHEEAAMQGDLAAAWSKLEGYAARFALLVHLVREASGDPALADVEAVDAESVAAGVALSRWFGDEAARVYAIIGGDTETPDARERRELLRIVRDRGGEITVRQVMHASRRYRADVADIEAALRRLVARGDLDSRVETPAGGGRPSEVFRLKTPPAGNETPENTGENGVVLPLPGASESENEPVSPATCPHDDVEETPTFDGYLNRRCRRCGMGLRCRPVDQPGSE
jgi:hypothetical protein